MAINVGDLVRITDRGYNYGAYRDMFVQLGFSSHEPRDNPYENGTILRVFATAPHPVSVADVTLYGLEPLGMGGDTQILMNQHGIEQVLPNKWAVRVTEDNIGECNEWRCMWSLRVGDRGRYMLCDILSGMEDSHSLPLHRGYAIGYIPDGYTEITTEQFRQYVLNQQVAETPTVDEPLFELPEKWSVAVTPENRIVLGNWRDARSLSSDYGYILSSRRGSRGFWVSDLRGGYEDYTEITFEQFQRYVLNPTPIDMPQTTTDMPTTQLTPQQQYAAAMAAMNLQVGDTVRIVCSTPDEDRGWTNLWDSDMDNFIGCVGQVTAIMDNNFGIRIDNGGRYNYPIYSLELVRRANIMPTVPEPTTNLENEQEDAVVTTTDRVICMTDKWNYINLGEVYEVIKRDEYYTYVKDSVGGESRYAHHYFEEWVDAETKAMRDSFKYLFGDHSKTMFKNAPDDVQKLMAKLYPKEYEYKGWLKLKKDINHGSPWLFDGLGIRLINEDDTSVERLQGTMRFDPTDYTLESFNHQGYTHIRFRQNR